MQIETVNSHGKGDIPIYCIYLNQNLSIPPALTSRPCRRLQMVASQPAEQRPSLTSEGSGPAPHTPHLPEHHRLPLQFRGLLGVHCTLRPACSPGHLKRPSAPKTPTASLPPPPLRLLPAGATLCRVGIVPTEQRRLYTAYAIFLIHKRSRR